MRIKLQIQCVITLIGAMLYCGVAASDDSDYNEARDAMINAINQDARYTGFLTKRQQLDEHVMAAMKKVPRHRFVAPDLVDVAYENRPLPIGHGQTISQPYIVALMTDLLNVNKDDVVLEVGTGSGYQAAVLAELVKAVYTIEIIPPLAKSATLRLEQLGYDNVTTRIADGYYGWQEHAPFDAIVVTAAASHIPPPLIKQLKPGARMIIPVGSFFFTQQLTIVEKNPDGAVITRQILPVAFVPLTGKH